MNKKLAAIVAVCAALVLTGCSASAAPSQTVVASSPAPTRDAATPEQVASVLAEYEPTWREVIDEAGECRFVWVMGQTVIEEMQGMSCYLSEQTIGLTAQLVIRDWGKLDIPASMRDLVDKTTATLQGIADIDLEAICGTGDAPAETDECNSALGSRNFYYGILEGNLDAWSPYI